MISPTIARRRASGPLGVVGVAAAGIASSFVAAVCAVYLGNWLDFDLYRFSILLLLPLGAMLTGFAAGSGYYFASLWLHVRPGPLVLLQVFFVAIAIQLFVPYLQYATSVSARAGDNQPVVQFFWYFDDLVTKSRRIFPLRSETGPLDFFGYVLAIVPFIGFLLGACGWFPLLDARPICPDCKRFKRVVSRIEKRFDGSGGLYLYLDGLWGHPFDSPEFERALREVHDAHQKAGAYRLRIEPCRCDGCGAQAINSEISVYRSGDWSRIEALSRTRRVSPGVDLAGAFSGGAAPAGNEEHRERRVFADAPSLGQDADVSKSRSGGKQLGGGTVGELIASFGTAVKLRPPNVWTRLASVALIFAGSLLLPGYLALIVAAGNLWGWITGAGIIGASIYAMVLSPVLVSAILLILHGRELRRLAAAYRFEADRRSPVLYLRPFHTDFETVKQDTLGLKFLPDSIRWLVWLYRPLVSALYPIRVETIITPILARCGPVVAIGNPREGRARYGAARLFVDNDRWEAVVRALCERCAFVVIKLGDTPGLQWELGMLFGSLPLSKIVVLLSNDDGSKLSPERYQLLLTRLPGEVALNLPRFAELSDARFIRFGDDGTRFLYRGEYNGAFYEVSELKVAAERLVASQAVGKHTASYKSIVRAD